MSKIYKTTFQLKRGLKENWESKNPILEYGEPGFSADEGILKIGDGLTTWKNLKPINANFLQNLTEEQKEQLKKDLEILTEGEFIAFKKEVVQINKQELTSEQKAQVRENIGINENENEIKKYIDERISEALGIIENGTY